MNTLIITALPSSGFLDPQSVIAGAGVWGLVVVCAIVFVETGLLVGFFPPGDTLLFFTGVLTFSGVISSATLSGMRLVHEFSTGANPACSAARASPERRAFLTGSARQR